MAKTKNEKVIELTQEDYDQLVRELDQRKNQDRETIASEIAAARELGDLRENHAYSVAMEKKDMNENRISDLEEMVKYAEIVASKSGGNIVVVGKKVKITHKKTKKSRDILLVGSEDTQAADPSLGKVSVDSPIGKAIFRAKVGETITVETPAGSSEYTVDKIL